MVIRSAPPLSTSRALQPASLETLTIPIELNDSAGLNRFSTGRAQIAADNDLDAIRVWLSRFVDTKTTFENDRKDAERLLPGYVVMLGKPLSSRTREDCPRYQRFLAELASVPMCAGARSMGCFPPLASARRSSFSMCCSRGWFKQAI